MYQIKEKKKAYITPQSHIEGVVFELERMLMESKSGEHQDTETINPFGSSGNSSAKLRNNLYENYEYEED